MTSLFTSAENTIILFFTDGSYTGKIILSLDRLPKKEM